MLVLCKIFWKSHLIFIICILLTFWKHCLIFHPYLKLNSYQFLYVNDFLPLSYYSLPHYPKYLDIVGHTLVIHDIWIWIYDHFILLAASSTLLVSPVPCSLSVILIPSRLRNPLGVNWEFRQLIKSITTCITICIVKEFLMWKQLSFKDWYLWSNLSCSATCHIS